MVLVATAGWVGCSGINFGHMGFKLVHPGQVIAQCAVDTSLRIQLSVIGWPPLKDGVTVEDLYLQTVDLFDLSGVLFGWCPLTPDGATGHCTRQV